MAKLWVWLPLLSYVFCIYLCIKNHKLQRKYRFASTMTKHGLLNISLLLCFLGCGCDVIKGASHDSQLPQLNDLTYTSFADSAAYCQFSPVKGKVISPFGYRGRHKHTGTDIKLHKGDTVRAALSGLVTMAAPYYGYGNLVIMKHTDKVETYYSHLSKCLVHEGDSVIAGEVVGLGGRSGRATTNHLHFEVRLNHTPQNAEKYFDFCNNTVKKPIIAKTPEIIRIEKSTEGSEPSAESNLSNDFVIIQKGDTLYALAKRYGTTVNQLKELNNLVSSNLKIGLKLKIK